MGKKSVSAQKKAIRKKILIRGDELIELINLKERRADRVRWLASILAASILSLILATVILYFMANYGIDTPAPAPEPEASPVTQSTHWHCTPVAEGQVGNCILVSD